VALHRDAMAVMAVASEGFCSLCNRELAPHDGLACCRCCGAIYSVESGRLGLSTCEEHSQGCEHLMRFGSADEQTAKSLSRNSRSLEKLP